LCRAFRSARGAIDFREGGPHHRDASVPTGPWRDGPTRPGGMEVRSMETIIGIALIIIATLEIVWIIRVVSANSPRQA
jgi:hypothetical protein